MGSQITYHDVMEWWSAVIEHECGVSKLFYADDPKYMLIGYGCLECDDMFKVNVNRLRALPATDELRIGFWDKDSRHDLLLVWKSGVVLIKEEW